MQNFRIAVVQHNSPLDDKAGNLQQTIDWTTKAKEAGAKLVCFPELNITGHAGHSDMVKQSEPVPAGSSVQTLIKLAKELDIYIAAGIAEDDLGIHYNTHFIVGPDGYIGKQRKVHLSGYEYLYFRAGTQLPVFQLPFARIGIIICYDNQHPEMSRCLAVKGAEVLLAPHAASSRTWPKEEQARRKTVAKRIEGCKKTWKKIHSCRSYDNGCYVAFCNTAGSSAGHIQNVEANHAGGLLIFDPKGNLIVESKSTYVVAEMVVADLDAEKVIRCRTGNGCTLQTRRPEIFKVLSEPTY